MPPADDTPILAALRELVATRPQGRTPADDDGMTHAKLARLTGVSQATISRIMSGEQAPSVETLGRIAAALRINPTKLGRLVLAEAGRGKP
jgi:DNA-binding XRE family transcriptional regulator